MPRRRGCTNGHVQKPISSGNVVDVTIVRGEIRRVISKDASHIGVSVKMDRPASVDIEIKPTRGRVGSARYLPVGTSRRLSRVRPPVESRGAFWLSNVVLDVTISASTIGRCSSPCDGPRHVRPEAAAVILRTHPIGMRVFGTG